MSLLQAYQTVVFRNAAMIHSNQLRHDMEQPGVYVFTRYTAPSLEDADVLYVGKSNNLLRRLLCDKHEKRDKAISAGATALYICQIDSDAEIDSLEAELIDRFCPPFNEKLNRLAGLLSLK